MIIEIQCLASPPGSTENRYQHIEAAIAVVQSSGLSYEVGALGTTVEGEPDDLWSLARRVHEACLASGADGVVSIVKVAQASGHVAQATVASLTGKYRAAAHERVAREGRDG